VPTLPNTTIAVWELLFLRPVGSYRRAVFLIGVPTTEATMNSLIYLVGLIVVVLVILSVLGLR
jgi:high-affinity Fe2+/Pb2+ permease